MYRTIARATQWAGKITVVVALGILIWSFADIAAEESSPFQARIVGPNQYLTALSSAASLAVSGMFAVGLGMMLERFRDE